MRNLTLYKAHIKANNGADSWMAIPMKDRSERAQRMVEKRCRQEMTFRTALLSRLEKEDDQARRRDALITDMFAEWSRKVDKLCDKHNDDMRNAQKVIDEAEQTLRESAQVITEMRDEMADLHDTIEAQRNLIDSLQRRLNRREGRA